MFPLTRPTLCHPPDPGLFIRKYKKKKKKNTAPDHSKFPVLRFFFGSLSKLSCGPETTRGYWSTRTFTCRSLVNSHLNFSHLNLPWSSRTSYRFAPWSTRTLIVRTSSKQKVNCIQTINDYLMLVEVCILLCISLSIPAAKGN